MNLLTGASLLALAKSIYYFVLHLHILGNTRTQNFDLPHIPGSQMAKIRKVYPPSLRPGEVPILRGQNQAKPFQNAKQLG